MAGEIPSLHPPKYRLRARSQPEDLEHGRLEREILAGPRLDEDQLSGDHGQTLHAAGIRMKLIFDHRHRHHRSRRRSGEGGLLASEIEDKDVAPLLERVELHVVGHDIVKVASRGHRGRSF